MSLRALALTAVCALIAQAASAATLAGVAWTGVRTPRGADAVLIVELIDASRADAAGVVVASRRVAPEGRARVAFTLDYDAATLDPRLTYVVAAKLVVDGRLAARTLRPTRVSVRAPTRHAALRLTPVATAGPGARPAADLVGRWTLEAIGGEDAPAGRPATLEFRADGRAGGHGGCNRFSGPYTAERSSLRFGALAATRMACPPPAMALEARYFAALQQTRAFRLERGFLHLHGADGAPLARLRRAPGD